MVPNAVFMTPLRMVSSTMTCPLPLQSIQVLAPFYNLKILTKLKVRPAAADRQPGKGENGKGKKGKGENKQQADNQKRGPMGNLRGWINELWNHIRSFLIIVTRACWLSTRRRFCRDKVLDKLRRTVPVFWLRLSTDCFQFELDSCWLIRSAHSLRCFVDENLKNSSIKQAAVYIIIIFLSVPNKHVLGTVAHSQTCSPFQVHFFAIHALILGQQEKSLNFGGDGMRKE